MMIVTVDEIDKISTTMITMQAKEEAVIVDPVDRNSRSRFVMRLQQSFPGVRE
jgi:hypothetical protein